MRMRVTAPDLVPVDWCTMTGPYGQFSPRYLQAGFSPLPLPAGKKKTPPAGFTGRNARGQLAPMADAAQVTDHRSRRREHRPAAAGWRDRRGRRLLERPGRARGLGGTDQPVRTTASGRPT